jgi:hypothetical protein
MVSARKKMMTLKTIPIFTNFDLKVKSTVYLFKSIWQHKVLEVQVKFESTYRVFNFFLLITNNLLLLLLLSVLVNMTIFTLSL